MKTGNQKIKLGKKTIYNLSSKGLAKIKGGDATWTITTTLASMFEQTCKCTFPPKCTSENGIM
ncbi:hypothetical protein [Ferruginibacter sp. SUN106]|uniref:hypothetical protein n=1 Tax=Ferruginibacter sp. SUN106 TaxID=2978348 RepID=UPI003D364898